METIKIKKYNILLNKLKYLKHEKCKLDFKILKIKEIIDEFETIYLLKNINEEYINHEYIIINNDFKK